HLLGHGLAHQERPGQRYRHDAIPVVLGDLQHVLVVRHGGVVDQDVDPAPFCGDVFDELIDVGLRRNFSHKASGVAVRLDDVFRNLVGAPLVVVDHGDLCAFRGEQLRRVFADIAAGTGDDRDLIFQLHVLLPGRLWTRCSGPASVPSDADREATMRDRQPSGGMLALLVALLLFVRIVAVSAAEPVPFKVGLPEAVNTALAIWMADDAGLYAASGLKVEIVNMQGGSRGAAELAAGRLDAMHVGLSSVIRLNKTGGDLRVVAALANVIRFTFFSAPGVTSAADL